MSESKFTPGPWRYACDSYHSTPCLGKTRHSKKAVVYQGNPHGDNVTIASHVKNWDDARLIAAAPDLLAACERVQSDWETNLSEAMALIRAAVAKAKGRP